MDNAVVGVAHGSKGSTIRTEPRDRYCSSESMLNIYLAAAEPMTLILTQSVASEIIIYQSSAKHLIVNQIKDINSVISCHFRLFLRLMNFYLDFSFYLC